MKKLLLILALFVVGCAEYNSLAECKLKETQKLDGIENRNLVDNYCKSLVPKKCIDLIDSYKKKYNDPNQKTPERKRFDEMLEKRKSSPTGIATFTDQEISEYLYLKELYGYHPRREAGYERACGDWLD